jgi:hypothetical protein
MSTRLQNSFTFLLCFLFTGLVIVSSVESADAPAEWNKIV